MGNIQTTVLIVHTLIALGIIGLVLLQRGKGADAGAAFGAGASAPEQAQDVHRHIRSTMAARDAGIADTTLILYGGSVKGDNAAGLFSMPDIDGGLIGGASLKADDFLAIATAAASI